MSKEFERTVQTSRALIEVAMIRLLLARLTLQVSWQAKLAFNALRSA
jgi:hypothetical protein